MATPSTSVQQETFDSGDEYQKIKVKDSQLEDLMEKPMKRFEESEKRSKLERNILEQQKTIRKRDIVSRQRQKSWEELQKTMEKHHKRMKEFQKTMERQEISKDSQTTLVMRRAEGGCHKRMKELQKTMWLEERQERLEERQERLKKLPKTKEESQKTFKRPKRSKQRAPKIRLDEHERRSEDEEGEEQSLVDLQKKKLEWPRLEEYTELPSKPNTKEEAGSSGISTADGEDDSLQSFLSKFRHTIGDSKTSKSSKVNFSTLRFAAGVFDKWGGHLALEHLGIDLYIPPDAVSDANTEIFLCARETEEPTGEETGKKWTPPVIQCGPHGITFNRHVILTVKHPAKDLTKWSFKFQASSTDIGETPDWKDLTQDPSAMCFAHEDKTVIFVDHFTLFNVTGELAGAEGGEEVEARRFRMGVFAEPLFQDTEMFQLRVRFWQDNDKEEQRAQNKERQLGAMQLSDDKVLHLAGDGGNLSVVLEWLFPGWRVTSGDRQTIPFSSLWNDHAEVPSCTFGLERQPSASAPGRLACRVTALQAAHPGNSVSIDVLKQLRPSQVDTDEAPESPSIATLDPEFAFLQLQPELRATPRCIPQFPDEEQFGRLCLELDLENPAGNDWRGLAEALHLPYDFIQWTEQKKDPTRRLLDFLVALHKEDSLRVLRDALAKVGHERALEMVEAMMGISNSGPTTGMQYRAEQQQSSGQQPFAGMWHDVAMPSGSLGTVPKEVHSLSAYSPNKAESRSDIVNGEGPSKAQQAASNGPTSSGSTTVEKVPGERSLGSGQESDATMQSSSSVANGNTSQMPSEEENNDSVTVPKAVQIQASACNMDYSMNYPGILDGGRGMGQSRRSTLSFRATPVAQK